LGGMALGGPVGGAAGGGLAGFFGGGGQQSNMVQGMPTEGNMPLGGNYSYTPKSMGGWFGSRRFLG
jgi:hypothetical protein